MSSAYCSKSNEPVITTEFNHALDFMTSVRNQDMELEMPVDILSPGALFGIFQVDLKDVCE